MKILITGGSGFIGSNLVQFLLKQKRVREIVLFDDFVACGPRYLLGITGKKRLAKRMSVKPAASSRTVAMKAITGNVLDPKALGRAMKGCDAVVHLAANTEVIRSMQQPRKFLEENVLGAINVLECARNSGVKQVALASSNAAVGEAVPPINESMLPLPISPYGAGKTCGEMLGCAYAMSYDLRVTSLRFSNAYGRYSDHKSSVVAKMIRELQAGKELTIYGDGSQTRDFVHAQDISQAIWLSIRRKGPMFGLFQIGSGKSTSILQLVRALAKMTPGKPRVIFGKSRRGEILRNYSDIRKAKRVLGFKPRTRLQNGLADTFEYFEQMSDGREAR